MVISVMIGLSRWDQKKRSRRGQKAGSDHVRKSSNQQAFSPIFGIICKNSA
jgi:hypothetical protein